MCAGPLVKQSIVQLACTGRGRGTCAMACVCQCLTVARTVPWGWGGTGESEDDVTEMMLSGSGAHFLLLCGEWKLGR